MRGDYVKYHIVQVSEKINDIAKKYNVSQDEIIKINRHINQIDNIVPGMKIRLPILSDEVSDELKDNFLDIEKYYPKVEDFKEVKVEKKKEEEIIENDINDDTTVKQPYQYQPQSPNYHYYQQQYPNYYQPQFYPQYQPPYYNTQPQQPYYQPIIYNRNQESESKFFEQPAFSNSVLRKNENMVHPKYFQYPLYNPPYPCGRQMEEFTLCQQDYDADVKEIKVDLREFVKTHTKIKQKKDPLDIL